MSGSGTTPHLDSVASDLKAQVTWTHLCNCRSERTAKRLITDRVRRM